MNLNLHSLLNGKNPDKLTDIIELNDGTRIKSIILDVGADQIDYYNGISMKRECMSANLISMLYLDNARITIPFPLIEMEEASLRF